MSDNNNNNNNNNNTNDDDDDNDDDISEGTLLNHWSYQVLVDWLDDNDCAKLLFSHQIYYFFFLSSFLSLFHFFNLSVAFLFS